MTTMVPSALKMYGSVKEKLLCLEDENLLYEMRNILKNAMLNEAMITCRQALHSPHELHSCISKDM